MANQNILIIDDDKNIREVVKLYLRKEGYEVTEAADGAIGFDLFMGRTYDLVPVSYTHLDVYKRQGFFPFTEPSAEVDVTCQVCGGKGCGACKGAGMIEVLGCGLVNPVVLQNCGLNPDEYSGFAFGLGIDRLANTKYGITDIRLLYENDARFLRQFV